MKKTNINQKIDDIFKEVGEFGPYQLFVFVLVGVIAFIPSIVGYSYSFYGATPEFRCKLPSLANDTYESMGEWHDSEILKYIPFEKDNQFKKCLIKAYTTNENFTLEKCDSWVYSKKYFEATLNSEVTFFIHASSTQNLNLIDFFLKWNLVCDKTPRKTLFSTLYFVGTYGVLLNGFLSDR